MLTMYHNSVLTQGAAGGRTTRDPGAAAGWQPGGAHQDPCRTLGETLVVFEGPRRLVWARRGPDQWRPVRVWPDAAEHEDVLTRIAAGRPVLVVVEELPCSVPLLPEEAGQAPPELAGLVGEDEHGLVLAVPGLDWLPPAVREHGEEFVRRSRSMVETDPTLLLSAFITDGDTAPGPVRFAVRTSARRTRDAEIVLLPWV
jgi:hypothetical protein